MRGRSCLVAMCVAIAGTFAGAASAQCMWTTPPDAAYQGCVGGSLTLHASADAPGGTYEWRRVSDGYLIATGANATVNALASDQSGVYRCTVTAPGEPPCVLESDDITIDVGAPPAVAPSGTVAFPVCYARDVVLNVQASGTGPFTYQWFKGTTQLVASTRIIGVASPQLRIISAATSDAGTYRCVVTNRCGARDSASFNVTVNPQVPPLTAPVSVLLCGTNSATFVAPSSASGATLRWYRGDTPLDNGGRISGVTTATLLINPVAPEDLGQMYRCVYTAACESVSTAGALLERDTPLCSLGYQRVVTGLVNPTYACAPVADFDRLFIVQRAGALRVLDLRTNTLQTGSYLTITGVSTGGEDGFLGLAFHPRFHENGYFYVSYSNTSSDAAIVRYRAQQPYMTSLAVEPGSATPVAVFQQNAGLHNGGWIGFRHDDTQGYLYITVGDGGMSSAARDPSLVNGKILRIDIDGPDNIPGNDDDADAVRGLAYRIPDDNPFANSDGMDEVIAMGVRNPWRCSFDRANGDMYIGDVGQGTEEEISFLSGETPLSTVIDFGWPCYEGRWYSTGTGCVPAPAAHTGPIFANRRNGGCAITGGFVYRGPLIPQFDGYYLFSDYCAGFLYAMDVHGVAQGTINEPMPFSLGTRMEAQSVSVGTIPAFGEDADGEVYVMDSSSIYRIVDLARVPADCNANGIDDALDISRGTEGDCDGDGVPDSCDTCCPACPADFDQDGGVTGSDISAFFMKYELGDPCADTDLDGGVTGGDIAAFFVAFEAGEC